MKNKQIKALNNISSKYLFGKDYDLLNSQEIQILNTYELDLTHPIWKEVVVDNINTGYCINNLGTLKSLRTGKEISYTLNHKGYRQVTLVYADRKHTTTIHRLVAQAFIPNPENKAQVNHINGNKECNWVGNLEWNTPKENIQHAVEHGLQTHPIGENANHSKYMDSQIHKVCELLLTGKNTNRDISKITGVDEYSISKIKCRKDWTHISSQYNIPLPRSVRIGSDSASSKYSDQQIHQVCQKIESGESLTHISRETGVGYDLIWRIKAKKNWVHISSNYNF